jgi:exopolyphosphatase/guanosine-5'-triphosphate,3'-diphosphate pyrophosphatase
VRRACIDIGSNTTRLLVADVDSSGLTAVHQERAFTHLALTREADDTIASAKLEEVAAVVAAQLRIARRLGCGEVHTVATAAIRRASNGDELAAAVRAACGLEVRILTGEEEARLAFLGAVGCTGVPAGELGVVDVGGGSCELVVGRVPDRVVEWWVSLPVGSGELARRHLHRDPPSAAEVVRAREEVTAVMAKLDPPCPAYAVAVGGSAASLARVAGSRLDSHAFAAALEVLRAAPSAKVARRFRLDVERVRLLPAGLLVLQAAAELFGRALAVAGGGLREGVLIDAAGG